MTSRRRFLAGTGLALALPGLARAKVLATEREGREDLSLWYEQPAGPWIEALPVGNGRLGAMVFGRVAQERVQLNIDTLFGGGPYTPDNPKALEALPRVRALLDQGRWHEASELAGQTMMAQPIVQMCGLLIGRSRVLVDMPRLRRLAVHSLVAGAAGVALVWLAHSGVASLSLAGMRRRALDELLNMYGNLAQMAIWAGGFVLLYQWARARAVLRVFAPYGRMSLTCYTTQALFGVPFFYGFGLGMYREVGAFHALFFGLGVFALQCAFAHWWLNRFCYGPLEWLWRAATLRTLAVPMRRATSAPRLDHPPRFPMKNQSS